jgi:hypothetical protein
MSSRSEPRGRCRPEIAFAALHAVVASLPSSPAQAQTPCQAQLAELDRRLVAAEGLDKQFVASLKELRDMGAEWCARGNEAKAKERFDATQARLDAAVPPGEPTVLVEPPVEPAVEPAALVVDAHRAFASFKANVDARNAGLKVEGLRFYDSVTVGVARTVTVKVTEQWMQFVTPRDAENNINSLFGAWRFSNGTNATGVTLVVVDPDGRVISRKSN